MGRKIFNPTKQKKSITNLLDNGYISDLAEDIRRTGRCSWSFNLGALVFYYDDKELDVDFTKFRLEIIYKKRHPPKVYILTPSLPPNTKHLWEDGRLCLYKKTNFEWKDEMSIEKNLFPSICTWLYHDSVWKQTGKWIGEEAEH